MCYLVAGYSPQTQFAKVMFLHLSVSHSVYRGVPAPEVPAPGGWAGGGCLLRDVCVETPHL